MSARGATGLGGISIEEKILIFMQRYTQSCVLVARKEACVLPVGDYLFISYMCFILCYCVIMYKPYNGQLHAMRDMRILFQSFCRQMGKW